MKLVKLTVRDHLQGIVMAVTSFKSTNVSSNIQFNLRALFSRMNTMTVMLKDRGVPNKVKWR